MFKSWVREIVEWRLAAYQAGASRRLYPTSSGNYARVTCKVIRNSSKKPILIYQPGRDKNSQIPRGPTEVRVQDRILMAKFAEIAVNKLHEPGSTKNLLPDLLLDWFGPNAGSPGTISRVLFKESADGWELRPERFDK